MPMTKAQQEYAIKRVSELANDRIRRLEKQYKRDEVRLSEKQKFDLIRSGEVLLKDSLPTHYSNFYSCYDFSGHEVEGCVTEEGKKLIDQERIKLQGAKDEIMLGDVQLALSIINSY